ncbi:hypothetical protein SAMN05428957_103355 [Oryzisolibacter propanilivorax]|uniref:Uncharacterized protein n=1 Tax=Oryzisolibacter propanilivorax TaxID=1527607 RepID=A0A1G9RNY6_9BURK|nr:hypothetical protein [Oryzisolibacter propanilivorax]SDM24125.1 hypothetical protein SAMN05428957_103355 [Oryzisolibacter propanilivorax]
MNPTHPTRPDPATRSPTVRDEKRAMRIIAVLLAVVVLAVIAFNLMAPKDRLRAPDEGAAPAATAQQQPATTAPGDGSVQRSAPERGDTPTPQDRAAVGAPAGGALPTGQDAR